MEAYRMSTANGSVLLKNRGPARKGKGSRRWSLCRLSWEPSLSCPLGMREERGLGTSVKHVKQVVREGTRERQSLRRFSVLGW